ncbi:MAG: HlyD family type I secretion periplasmic adaptor subunit [Pseudomonadota bacterium]
MNWSARPQIILGFTALFLLIGGLGTWSVATEIAGAIIAPGQIEVESNRQVVQHPEGGVVGEILVDDGDFVEAGDVVLRLDDTILQSELAIIEAQYYELLARRGRLLAESIDATEVAFDQEVVELAMARPDVMALLQGQVSLFQSRIETTRQSVDQLRERQQQISLLIEGRNAQLAALDEQLGFIEQELADQQRLFDQGLTQATRVLSLQRERAGLLGQVGELQAGIAESRGRIAEIEIQVLSLTSTRQEEAITTLRDIESNIAELRERRLSALETLSRLDIRAPSSGFVLGRTVHALRAVVRAAEPVMYVVPQDSPLVITSRIETINIDQVRVGQDAVLTFSAFDQRTTPQLEGQVTRVSADIIVDEATGMQYYETQILPKTGELDKLGNLVLIPGMPVDAFIQTGERSPLSFLVKPLSDYFNKAFRET